MMSLLLLLVGLLFGVARSDCPSSKFTELVRVDQKCFGDDQAAGYMFSPGDNGNRDFIIWLGDSDICKDRASCGDICGRKDDNDNTVCPNADSFSNNASTLDEVVNCFFTSFTCDTSLWDINEVCPTTILDEFKSFNRVFVPQCSFDMFLGRNNDGLFNGARILEEVLESLAAEHGFGSDSNVVIGGTRNSGIGALNFISLITQLDNPPRKISAIIDSAWSINLPNFATTEFDTEDKAYKSLKQLQDNVENWIDNSELDQDCKDKFDTAAFRAQSAARNDPFNLALMNCLFPSELIANSPLLQNLPILFIQSQYDGTFAAKFGLLDESAEDGFADNKAFTTSSINFLEQIGSTVRLTAQATFHQNENSPHKYFLDTCTDHGTIIPVSTLTIPERIEQIGAAGTATISRDNNTWQVTEINDRTTKSVIEEFMSSVDQDQNPRELIVDSCGSFLCGKSCQVSVQPFVVSLKTSTASHVLIIGLALAIILGGWVGFLCTYARVVLFRNKTKGLWRKLEKQEAMRQQSKDSLTLETTENEDINERINNEFLDELAQRTNVVSLMVTNVTYDAPPRTPGGDPYTILKDVSLSVKPNEVHVLMGPSGSGKSTLLDVLATTRESGTLKGTHYINGVPSHLKKSKFMREWLQMNLSYVRQQDVLFPLLTVRQHLTHAAWLMLPESMPALEKIKRVYRVAKLVGLEHTLDTKIGDGGLKIEGGISGGERRRVSVATQLLKLPAALVLDEPTSGLDSTNALLLVSVLQKLAHRANVCVFLTIHQPRREIFNLLDRMTILLEGRITFSGTPKDASRFFRFRLDEVNIGDDVLDKLEEFKGNQRALINLTRKYAAELGKTEDERIRSEITYLNKKIASGLKSRLKANARREGRYSWHKVTSTWLTIKVLLSRTILRGGFDIERTTMVSLIGGVLVGTVFLGNESYAQSAGLAYLVVATMTFLQSTFLGTRYQLEKGMWTHEKEAGTTVSWIAFLGSLYLRNMVTSTIEGLTFAVPTYFMGKLNTDDPARFQLFLILLVLVAIVVISQNTFVEIDRIRRGGLSGPDLRQAALVNMSLLALGVLFNGFIIRLDDIPGPLRWITYCMVTFWGFVGILVNNFRNFEYPCDVSVLECATRTGDSFIKEFEYDEFDVYEAIIALCAMTLIFHVLGAADFFFRFVLKKTSLTREEMEEMRREFSAEEKNEGVIGSTMRELIALNLNPEGGSKRRMKRSKSKLSKTSKSSKETDQFGSPKTKIKVFNTRPSMESDEDIDV